MPLKRKKKYNRTAIDNETIGNAKSVSLSENPNDLNLLVLWLYIISGFATTIIIINKI